jgi:hypothetical protein
MSQRLAPVIAAMVGWHQHCQVTLAFFVALDRQQQRSARCWQSVETLNYIGLKRGDDSV